MKKIITLFSMILLAGAASAMEEKPMNVLEVNQHIKNIRTELSDVANMFHEQNDDRYWLKLYKEESKKHHDEAKTLFNKKKVSKKYYDRITHAINGYETDFRHLFIHGKQKKIDWLLSKAPEKKVIDGATLYGPIDIETEILTDMKNGKFIANLRNKWDKQCFYSMYAWKKLDTNSSKVAVVYIVFDKNKESNEKRRHFILTQLDKNKPDQYWLEETNDKKIIEGISINDDSDRDDDSDYD